MTNPTQESNKLMMQRESLPYTELFSRAFYVPYVTYRARNNKLVHYWIDRCGYPHPLRTSHPTRYNLGYLSTNMDIAKASLNLMRSAPDRAPSGRFIQAHIHLIKLNVKLESHIATICK